MNREIYYETKHDLWHRVTHKWKELIREARQLLSTVSTNIQKLSEELYKQKRLLAQAMSLLPSTLDSSSSDDNDQEVALRESSLNPLDEELNFLMRWCFFMGEIG